MQLRKGFAAALTLFVFIGGLGMIGCADNESIDVEYMAGTYDLAEITLTPTGGTTTTLIPPYIEGTITLTASGTFSYDYIIVGSKVTGFGTFTVDDPEVVFTELGDVKGIVTNVTHGIISKGGDQISISETGPDNSFTWKVTRQR